MQIAFHHSSCFLIFFSFLWVAATMSDTLMPFSDISSRILLSLSFFFFSAHFAHSFEFIAFVSCALFIFYCSMFFRFSRFFIEPFPLIFFFFSLFSKSSLSAFSWISRYSSWSTSRFVLSMLPSTFGSIVIVSGGSLSSSLCTRASFFCFLVSKGLLSKVS